MRIGFPSSQGPGCSPLLTSYCSFPPACSPIPEIQGLCICCFCLWGQVPSCCPLLHQLLFKLHLSAIVIFKPFLNHSPSQRKKNSCTFPSLGLSWLLIVHLCIWSFYKYSHPKPCRQVLISFVDHCFPVPNSIWHKCGTRGMSEDDLRITSTPDGKEVGNSTTQGQYSW